jgi:hypothetical protein
MKTLSRPLNTPIAMTRFAKALALQQQDLTHIRRLFLTLLALLIWATSSINARGDDAVEATPTGDGPVVEVIESQPYVQHGITITPARGRKVTINGLRYEDVYNSIPYHRSDAAVNPGYRHDATMEILFGELRPTTIVRNSTIPATQPVYSRPFYGYGAYGIYPWRYGNYGLNYGLGYGLSTYRWALWDRYLYRHSAFMFGVR